MKRVKASWVIASIAAVVWVTAWSHLGAAQGTDGNSNPAIGTWKLNLEKSRYDPGPPPKSQTQKFEAVGKDGAKNTTEGVAADGSRIAYSWTANYDGKDYPVTGVGTPNGSDTIAVKRIDANTFETTLKKAGKVVLTNTTVYSKDGKLRIITGKGTNAAGQPTTNVTVYDRQ
jgi:hypothetical protein